MTLLDIESQLKISLNYIRRYTHLKPQIGIVLGSGLGSFADNLTSKIKIRTAEIPHYPKSTIEGHKGNLIFGMLHKIPIVAFQGRVHFYETGNLYTVLYPILVAHRLGVRTIILTNAAGSIKRNLVAGDLMLITDQINLTFENPYLFYPSLTKKNNAVYDEKLKQVVFQAAREKGIELKHGVYCGVKGPSYETAAEIEMIRRIGGDAVGMSTVNEASLAAAMGMKVVGISCISNLATGISLQKLSHKEVTEVTKKVKKTFAELLSAVIRKLNRQNG